MPNITVTKTFKFAERGIDVFEYLEGETVDVSDECAEVALAEDWATLADAEAITKRKTKPVPKIIDENFVTRETTSADADIFETK